MPSKLLCCGLCGSSSPKTERAKSATSDTSKPQTLDTSKPQSANGDGGSAKSAVKRASTSSTSSDEGSIAKGWGESFGQLLKSNRGREEFIKYLKKNSADEDNVNMMEFLQQCEEYRKENDEGKRKEKAESIYNSYLGVEGKDIPITDTTILPRVQQKFGEVDAFQEAEDNVKSSLRDSYYEFIKSEDYQNLVK